MTVAKWSPSGIIAIDKVGDRILFLDPQTLETIATIDDMPTLPHELAISPDRGFAFVPAYGDGVHGDNPHPNHLVSVIDLRNRRRDGDIDLRPLEAPHTLRFAADGRLYVCCENSATVAIVDPGERAVIGKIATGSANSHRLAILSGRGLICTDNEEDASISFLDMASGSLAGRMAFPCSIAGIDRTADETRLIVSSADNPDILLIDVESRSVIRTLPLRGHRKPAQVVRFSPDGRWLLVVGDHEPVITLVDLQTGSQSVVPVGAKPMDGAFHPDGSRLLVANEEDATLSLIDLEQHRVTQTVPCGKGCETLGYF